MDQGVNMLVIGDGGAWEFVESPSDPPERNGGVYRTNLNLKPDGAAEGTRTIDFRGLYNVSVRYSYQNRAKIKDKLESTLGQNYPGTTVEDIEISDLDDPEQDEWLRFGARIPRFAEKSGKNLSFRTVLFPYEASRSHAYLEQREHDLVLNDAPWFRERELTVRMPEGYQVGSFPEPANVNTPFGSVQTAYSTAEGAVTCYTKIVWQAMRVSVEDYAGFRTFCRRLDEAEEARVVLTGTGE
jgi:hypothetical protein